MNVETASEPCPKGAEVVVLGAMLVDFEAQAERLDDAVEVG